MIGEQRMIMVSGLRHFCKGSNYVEVNIEINKIIVLQWKKVLMNLQKQLSYVFILTYHFL